MILIGCINSRGQESRIYWWTKTILQKMESGNERKAMRDTEHTYIANCWTSRYKTKKQIVYISAIYFALEY